MLIFENTEHFSCAHKLNSKNIYGSIFVIKKCILSDCKLATLLDIPSKRKAKGNAQGKVNG